MISRNSSLFSLQNRSIVQVFSRYWSSMEKSVSKKCLSKQQTTTTATSTRVEANECQVCGSSAQYCYYGVVACGPCKMFFKRKAEQGLVCSLIPSFLLLVPSTEFVLCFSSGNVEMWFGWTLWSDVQHSSCLYLLSTSEMLCNWNDQGKNSTIISTQEENKWKRKEHQRNISSSKKSAPTGEMTTSTIFGKESSLSFSFPLSIF